MSMNDLLSDMLTRIRNAQNAKLAKTRCPAANLSAGVLDVLTEEGYIRGWNKVEVRSGVEEFEIELKYTEEGAAIQEITRVSKPGRRKNEQVRNFKRYYNGLGIAILSTSKGVMADHKARQENVGGEVLCSVF